MLCFIQLSVKDVCGTSGDIRPEILSATVTDVSLLYSLLVSVVSFGHREQS